MKIRKKAVSALVATVLLILITVAAVGIIWGAIMPMINQATQYGQACMNARLQIDTQQGYTCYNGTGTPTSFPNRVVVQVERGSEEFIPVGMQIVVAGGGQSKVFTVKERIAGVGPVSQLPENLTTDILEIPGTNEARTYIIDSAMTTTTEVSVAPIVKVGNTEKVCDISSRAALTACRTG